MKNGRRSIISAYFLIGTRVAGSFQPPLSGRYLSRYLEASSFILA